MSKFEALKTIGAEIKRDKTGQLIIGFTSQKMSNEQLDLLKNVSDDCLMAFYRCDLSLLKKSNFKRIALIYCQFEDKNLYDICEIPSLGWLKLFDTPVTNEAVEKILFTKTNLKIMLN
jgi:hypothetical protein